jgi:hypothetical protein
MQVKAKTKYFGQLWTSRRNFWGITGTPLGINHEWCVCVKYDLYFLPTNPHWTCVVAYGPFSLCVIHKEGLCTSSDDINELMMMMMLMMIYFLRPATEN